MQATMSLLPYLVPFLLYARVASAACYNINGNIVTDPDAVPCGSGSTSMCCDSNRGASSPYTPDTCLPNGLCQNIFTNLTTNKPDTNYWREGCSDSGWNSRYCLTGVCTGSSEVDSDGDAEMTPCDGTATSATWCCGTHNTNCCGTGQEISLAAILGAPSSSSTSSSATQTQITSTSQSSPSSTPIPTSTPTPTPAPAKGLSTGAKAGIGIGSAALAVLAAGVVCLYFFLQKKGSGNTSGGDGIAAADATGYYKPKVELGVPSNQHQPYEMHGDGGTAHAAVRGELP